MLTDEVTPISEEEGECWHGKKNELERIPRLRLHGKDRWLRGEDDVEDLLNGL